MRIRNIKNADELIYESPYLIKNPYLYIGEYKTKVFKNNNPILLLDDVFSELDDIKKNNIIKYISEDIQVIITTTEIKKINKKKFSSVSIFKIKNGEIIRTEEVENERTL